MLRRTLFAAATAALLLPAGARAEMLKFHAYLDGAHEVPGTTSPGIGTLTAELDSKTMELHYTLTFMNLTGPAVAAHFHGPADAGSNAGVALPIPAPLNSPVEAKAKLTKEQIADLMAGKWYVNIHTAANKGGEIRGQVMEGALTK